MTYQVVIIGAGYAGLPAAKRLARRVRPDEVAVSLISAFDDFVERPRLHQLAVGQDIEQVPLTRYLQGSGVDLVAASVIGIDLAAQEVRTTDAYGRQRAIRYDTLVYALGSNIDVASVPGVAEHCATLVGASSALELRARLTALAGTGAVTVCGGGLTGLETVAEIAFAFPTLRTQLVSASTPGGWLSAKGRRYLADTLTELGIQVIDDARVQRVEPGRLVLADRRHVPFELCAWAGGFTVPALARTAGLAVNANGRALVDKTLPAGRRHHRRPTDWRQPETVPLPLHPRVHQPRSQTRPRAVSQRGRDAEGADPHGAQGRYKNLTLNGARLLFRHPGARLARRRRVRPCAACST